MASMHATASKLTFFRKKCHLYANKRSGSVRIKEQYSLRANLAYLAQPGLYYLGGGGGRGCQTVHQDPPNAKQSSPKILSGICENAWFPRQPLMRF